MTTKQCQERTFDVRMYAAISVRCKSVEEGRELIRRHVVDGKVNFGEWPDGSPISSTAVVDDDELPLRD